MSDVVFSSQWIRQRMNRSRSTSCDCHSAVKCAQQHVIFCFHIFRIVVSFFNIFENQFRRSCRIRIGKWSSLFGGITLHRMSQRVYAGRCHNRFRQFSNHLRIQQHVIWNHAIIDNTLFGFLFRNRNNRITGGL